MQEDPSNIRNWQRRADGITTSGKLEEGDIERLAAIGVEHVINLALDDHPEALAGEAQLLEASGIAYTHIPVPFDAPVDAHVEAFRKALLRKDGPTHVHCIANYRVTAFFYLLDQEAGLSEPEARTQMAKVWDPITSNDPRAQPWKALLTSP